MLKLQKFVPRIKVPGTFKVSIITRFTNYLNKAITRLISYLNKAITRLISYLNKAITRLISYLNKAITRLTSNRFDNNMYKAAIANSIQSYSTHLSISGSFS